MQSQNSTRDKLVFLRWGAFGAFLWLIMGSMPGCCASVVGQETPPVAGSQEEAPKQDPATRTDIITETLKTIREVDKLNEYIEQNKGLRDENQTLKQQIASLTTQVGQLTQEIQTQNEQLKRQLLTLPEFTIKSKVVSRGGGQAILDVGGKSIRIRENVQMSIPVENGVWTLIQVQKITKEVVEINFLDLDRVVTLYD